MIKTTQIQLQNVALYVAIAGPEDGPAVLLLHGFPDAWFGWENQIKTLAKKGYFVIAPNQRGYAKSAQPLAVKDYSLNLLADDIIALADYFNLSTFYLAGHDFGGMVAWIIAAKHPQRIKKLAILSAPHLLASWEYNQTHWQQKFKSWYILFFQLSVVPEFVLRRFNFHALINNLPLDLSAAQKNRYRMNWQEKQVLSTMLNWYRALLKDLKTKQLKGSNIAVDTLIMWGAKDKYLHKDLARLSLKYCSNAQLKIFEGTGHWLMHDQNDAVTDLLIKHFSN